MKSRHIIIPAVIAIGCTGVQGKVVPSVSAKVDGKTYCYYPVGVVPDEIPTPAFRVEENNGQYHAALKKVAVLCGNRPDVNTVTIDSDYDVPELIVADGELVPVVAVEGAFAGSKAKNIFLHDNISRIGAYSFGGASEITTLTLPAGLDYIGWDAFKGMDKVRNVYMRSFLPPTCEMMLTDNKIINISLTENREVDLPQDAPMLWNSGAVIHVPVGSLWFYRQHPCFAGLKLVEYTHEYGQPDLTSNNGADGVFNSLIVGNAGNGTLAVLAKSRGGIYVLPHTLTANDYQMGMSMTDNPYQVRYLAGKVFSNDEYATTIAIPSTVISVGAKACQGTGVASVMIPPGLRFVGPKAFANLTHLRRVIVRRNAESPELLCAPDAFDGSVEKATLYIDRSLIDVTQAPWNKFNDIRDISLLP